MAVQTSLWLQENNYKFPWCISSICRVRDYGTVCIICNIEDMLNKQFAPVHQSQNLYTNAAVYLDWKNTRIIVKVVGLNVGLWFSQLCGTARVNDECPDNQGHSVRCKISRERISDDFFGGYRNIREICPMESAKRKALEIGIQVRRPNCYNATARIITQNCFLIWRTQCI